MGSKGAPQKRKHILFMLGNIIILVLHNKKNFQH